MLSEQKYLSACVWLCVVIRFARTRAYVRMYVHTVRAAVTFNAILPTVRLCFETTAPVPYEWLGVFIKLFIILANEIPGKRREPW